MIFLEDTLDDTKDNVYDPILFHVFHSTVQYSTVLYIQENALPAPDDILQQDDTPHPPGDTHTHMMKPQMILPDDTLPPDNFLI
jgi:hypothetical protein